MKPAALIAVLLALGVSAEACASSGGSRPASQAGSNCAVSGSKRIGGTRAVTLVRRGSRYLACASGGRPLALGSSRCLARPSAEAVGVPVAAGRFVALAVRHCGVDTALAGVRLIDVRSRRAVFDAPAGTGANAPETVESVPALRVRADGALAWVVDSSSLAAHTRRRELWVADSAHRRRLLDSGGAISATSLRLARAVHWRDAGRARSAPLG